MAIHLVFTLDKDWKIHKCNDIDVEEVESSVLLTSDVEENCYILCYEEVTEGSVPNLLKYYDERDKQFKKDRKRTPKSSSEVLSKCGPISVHASDISTCNDGVWLNDQVWDLLNSRVETYDSGQTDPDAIQPFIQQILKQKECPRGRRVIRVKKNLPKQNNIYDCGVFVCMFAKHVSLHREINFTAHEMPELRRTLALEILGENLV